MLMLLLLACTAEEEVVPVECDTGFEVTWENFGEGFMATNCDGCHAATTRDRNGAPDYITFDTEHEAMTQAADILRTVEAETMPPAGGVLEDDKTLLRAWLECYVD